MVEDYADTVIDSSDLGRDWAPVPRWAIALDDGRLVSAAPRVVSNSLESSRLSDNDRI